MAQAEVETLERLVGAATVSRDPMIELASYVAQRCEDAGFRVELDPDPSDPGKANVLAFAGPEVPDAGLILSGHLDVVPVDGQDWASDPFVLTERDGKLYGRGASDMKAFVAASLVGLERMDLSALRAPLALIWTHDEEVGCVGSARLARALAASPRPLPKECWIGEPTDFQIFRMHPGHTAVRVTTLGRSAHSSKPDLGASAIRAMARVLAVCEGLILDLERERDEAFADYLDRPYVTFNTGTLHGGTAVNMVPDRCEMVLGYRPLPGQSSTAVALRLQERLEETYFPPGTTCQIEILRETPSLLTPEGTPLQGLLHDHCCGGAPSAASFATDGGNLAKLGVETLVFGPGSIDVAHAPNEYVEAHALGRCVDMVVDVVSRRCL